MEECHSSFGLDADTEERMYEPDECANTSLASYITEVYILQWLQRGKDTENSISGSRIEHTKQILTSVEVYITVV